MDTPDWLSALSALPGYAAPLKVTRRTMQEAIEAFLVNGYTRPNLDRIMFEELSLPAPSLERAQLDASSKRGLVQAFIQDMSLPELVVLAQRLVSDIDGSPALEAMITRFHADGGVSGEVKNLIFAANGPKPELVLRDAVSNDIEIVRNAEYCLVYDQPIGPEGLSFRALVQWWRAREAVPAEFDDRAVGLQLYERLKQSLAGNVPETQLYEAYNLRYRQSFDIPALVPQVYLHYDPYTQRQRAETGSVLARQRMDFLLLISQRRRVVLEIDGRQHYADDDGRASTARYAAMAAEDRRLKLAGYEVYRFGGKELDGSPASRLMLGSFFDDLALTSRS